MKSIFKKGDLKIHRFLVEEKDMAIFEGTVIHRVCSTFALAREVEWSARLFVLEMKDNDEEGVGTMLTIDHQSPAFVGDEVEILASVASINGHKFICNINVMTNNRVVAKGKTGQKILKKEKIKQLFTAMR